MISQLNKQLWLKYVDNEYFVDLWFLFYGLRNVI